MIQQNQKFDLLQLFADGAAAPAAEEAAAQEGGEAPQTAAQPQTGDAPDKAREAPSQADRFIAQQVQRWHTQAQQAREIYPALDLAGELRNPQFCQLLRTGLDVESAYALVHRDQILASAMHHAARVARQQLSSAIASGAVRPPENGLAAGSGAVSVADVSRLTRQQRDDIRKRAARGEKIRF